MSNIRFYITLYFTKAVIKFMKLLGFNATNIPGEIALKLCPDILGRLKSCKTTIAVTGTNGKTSTNNILASSLKNAGYSVIDNGFGSNILSGIVSCLITNCDLKGVCHQDFACLEVDERSSIKIYKYLTPDYIICTNLQRDSLMRNANVDYIFNIINNSIPESSTLILNGDDLISSQLGKGKNQNRYFYQVLKQENDVCRDNLVKDLVVCPICGNNITWDFVRNHSIGQGHCDNCGFKNETAQYVFKTIENGNVVALINGEEVTYPLVGYRSTDYYNEIAVIALFNIMNLPQDKIVEGLSKTTVPKSRLKTEVVNGIEVLSILSKGMNPIAISSSCDVINKDKRRKAVIMYLDDGHETKSSSEMISYIYDVDFEFFKDANISQIMIGGKRANDYLVRMLYGGLDKDKISISIDPAHTADNLKVKDLEVVYILFDMYDLENYQKIFDKVVQLCKEGE